MVLCVCLSGGLSGQEWVSFCGHFPVTKGIYVPGPLPVVVEVGDHSLWTYKSYAFICTGWWVRVRAERRMGKSGRTGVEGVNHPKVPTPVGILRAGARLLACPSECVLQTELGHLHGG